MHQYPGDRWRDSWFSLSSIRSLSFLLMIHVLLCALKIFLFDKILKCLFCTLDKSRQFPQFVWHYSKWWHHLTVSPKLLCCFPVWQTVSFNLFIWGCVRLYFINVHQSDTILHGLTEDWRHWRFISFFLFFFWFVWGISFLLVFCLYYPSFFSSFGQRKKKAGIPIEGKIQNQIIFS